MSIPSARLLAHLCCTLLLLLSVTCIITANPIEISATAATPENKSSILDLLLKKDKCQYNLTGSNQSLEAKSSIYQDLGFSKCEYIIQAPSSRFLLLNFTDIHSQFDMLVETSVRHQHLEQAATVTTPVPESVFAVTQLIKPQNHELVNSTSIHLDSGTPVSTIVDKFGGVNINHSNNLHNINKHNSSLSDRDSSILKTELLTNTSLSTGEPIIGKKHSESSQKGSPSTEEDSDFKLSTAEDFSDEDTHTDPRVPSCSLKLIIEEVNSSSGSKSQVICWDKSRQHRIPLVFQYTVPIRITYVWDRLSQSGFSLDFKFLRPEAEIDCFFQCNNYLCLPEKQLCDGYIDCPDNSDEHSSACALVRQHQESGEPQVINVIVIVIYVILGIIVVLILIFMISHIRCRDGACRGGDSLLQPPNSQSSEVCRSPSGSMQECGQYEALLHQHPQRQTTTASSGVVVASSWCLEHQQLLHPQQHKPGVDHHRVNQNHQQSQLHQLCLLSSEVKAAVSSDTSSGLLQQRHEQSLIQHRSQQQQQKHKPGQKHVSPDELYPPNIPLSADGEEGYAMSQKVLHSEQQLEQNWQVENEVFRPPPNKTVYDRDSPPPPYSLSPPGTQILDSHFPFMGVVCVLRQARSSLTPQGSPTGVPPSHSLSCHH